MKKLGKTVIFENLKEVAAPEHSALVLWDCQNGLVNNIFNRDEFLSNLKEFLAAARQNKLPVIYSKITPLPSGYQSSWQLFQAMRRFNVDDPAKIPIFMKSGSPDAEINAEVAPTEGEVILYKHYSNIFFGTNFEQLMRFRGVQTIIFCGIATEYGVEHSAREAAIRGFYPIVVTDCVSSSDRTAHETALKLMPRLCLLATSKDIIQGWAT